MEDLGKKVGGYSEGDITLNTYNKGEYFNVYDDSDNKLTSNFTDRQQCQAFIDGYIDRLRYKSTPKYEKRKYHLIKRGDSIILRSDRQEVTDAYLEGYSRLFKNLK